MKLKNKIAIITGAARGIGKETAELFCQEGASVIIWDLLDVGEQTAADIRSKGLKCEFMKVGITDPASVDTAVASIIKTYGTIDILVNNAGITRDKTLAKMSLTDWQQVIDVNLTGVFNCTRAVVPFMIEKKYGRILCTSSVVGIHGNFGQTNYAASKAGIIAMVRTWAKELAKNNITANAVAPGFISTDMTALMPEEVLQSIISTIPARRMGTVGDIARAFLFLASEDAAYVNGQVLGVNGGYAI